METSEVGYSESGNQLQASDNILSFQDAGSWWSVKLMHFKGKLVFSTFKKKKKKKDLPIVIKLLEVTWCVSFYEVMTNDNQQRMAR